MKNLFKILISGLIVVSFALVFSCSSDDDGGGDDGGLDPNSFCTGELCSTSDFARNECIDDYNACKALNESTDDECRIFALNACNL